MTEGTDEPNWKAKAERLWERLIGWFALAGLVGGTIGLSSVIVKAVKQWLQPKAAIEVAYSPPKPTRPIGFVFLSSTGEKGSETDWYLRADTVLGPRERRLFWVTLNYEKNKDIPYKISEYLSRLSP